MAKIKRSEVQSFLDIAPGGAHTLALIGDGVISGKIAYNPKTTSETYINEDNATISVDSYAPTMPVEQTAISGDSVFDFVDALRVARATLSDAETYIVNVWMYEAGGPTVYPAEKQAVSIQIDDFGGDGGAAVKINYTINYIGAPVAGTFNAGSSTFTPS